MSRSNHDDELRVTTHGKQVKLDGQHFADAASEEAARCIADAVNWIGSSKIPPDVHDRLMQVLS